MYNFRPRNRLHNVDNMWLNTRYFLINIGSITLISLKIALSYFNKICSNTLKMNKLSENYVERVGVINLSQPYQIAYWTEHFGVTEKLLQDAVDAVGDSVEKVEVYINSVITYYMHTYAI